MIKFNKLFISLGLILIMSACSQENKQGEELKPGWPEINAETKPWTRWWWHGGCVDKKNLTANLEEYAKAGLGGLELTNIYGIKGKEDQFLDFTSPEWMEMLTYTLTEAKRLDLGMDLAIASGWPFGGPWVSPDDACKYLEIKAFKLKKGESFDEKIEFIQKPIVRTVGKRANIENLNDPIASNDSMQIYAFDQVRFPRKLNLAALMAYSEKGEVIEITDKVSDDGTLNWENQDQDWTLVGAFTAWHGKMVERAGPGGEGDVIDHFSLSATNNYLKHFDESFNGHDISYLRAFFNDSYEVDDAVGNADWTPEFFKEFELKRGYDLKKHLPELLGEKTEDEQNRVLCDFRETISDLLLEKYTIPWQKWAENKNKIIRNQSHGSPANILDLYAASDIPETEGTDILNIKFASSAAHITGKKLISAEAATWLNEHFLGNLSQSKQNVDRYLIGGINHVFYHGTTYSPINEEWPGRMFYASAHYAPSNTFWKDFPVLNNYIARSQSFLQRGAPDNDILLYFPIHDQWMDKGRGSLHHFHGAEHSSKVYVLADTLQNQGYSFDFISDKQVSNLKLDDSKIITEGNTIYKTILIPSVTYIPLETIQNLIKLAENGAKIIFMDQLPENVPGLNDFESQIQSLAALKESLQLKKEEAGIQEYSIGSGNVFVGKDFNQLLQLVDIKRETLVDNGLQYIKLNDHQITTYFVSNWSGETVSGWIPLETSGETIVLYDPMTGAFGKAKSKSSETDQHLVLLKLQNGESAILQIWNSDVDVDDYPYWSNGDVKIELNEGWKLEFITGGPSIPESSDNIKLGDSWTTLSDAACYFSGTAKYSLKIELPEIDCDAWELYLGEVCESAHVIFNGKSLGTLIGPEYSIIISKEHVKRSNVLEIEISNLMANHIIYMDKNNLPYRNFYNINFAARLKENLGPDRRFTAINWEPLKSGLIGPVSIQSLNKE